MFVFKLSPNSQNILSPHVEAPFTQLIYKEPTIISPVDATPEKTPIVFILVFVSKDKVFIYSGIYFIYTGDAIIYLNIK